jgi:hypothetical protein
MQCAVRKLCPTTLSKSYLGGIADCLEQAGEDHHLIRAEAADRDVKRALRGFQRIYERLHPRADNLKLAFGLDLARDAKALMTARGDFRQESKGNSAIQELMQLRVYVCMAVGIYFMLRKSEHLCGKGNSPSATRRKHLDFTNDEGRAIPYDKVGLPGHVSHKVTFIIKFSKTDASGFGRRPSHVRQEGRESASLCVVQLLERFIRLTRDLGATREDRLYYIPGYSNLREETLHSVMQSTTLKLGIYGPGTRATSHSLRYGGATMMAAAGFPQYLIAHYGGWKENSESLKIYCRPSDESQARVSEYMFQLAKGTPSRAAIQDAMARVRAM